MISAADYPRVAGLLIELLQLDETDAQLPLELLLNMSRASLDVPFRGLLALADRLAEPQGYAQWQPTPSEQLAQLIYELNKRYPALDEGGLFMKSDALETLEQEAYDEQWLGALPGWRAVQARRGLSAAILDGYGNEYTLYEPVMFMLQLSFKLTPTMRANRLRALELELSFHPVVRQLILDMAAESAGATQD